MVWGDIAALAVLTIAVWSLFNCSRWRVLAYVIVAAALAWIFWRDAKAGDAPHPSHATDHFYASWMMPDAPQVSCCSNQDCAPAQAKFEGGRWFARWSDADEWTIVPDYKVERERDMPDGRAHLCARMGPIGLSVLCFGAGAGG